MPCHLDLHCLQKAFTRAYATKLYFSFLFCVRLIYIFNPLHIIVVEYYDFPSECPSVRPSTYLSFSTWFPLCNSVVFDGFHSNFAYTFISG